MNGNFVIRGDLCWSRSQTELETVADGYLVCLEGRSAGAYRTLPERYAGLPLADYRGHLVLPGLTDLHVHGPQFGFRALGMDLELIDWLNTHTFPEEARFSDPDYAAGAYRDFVRDVRRGPNTRAVVFATRHVPATLLLMDLLEESGLVTMVGKVNMDRNATAGLSETDAAASLRDTRAWLAEADGRYRRTAPILTPRFIPACSDALMAGLGELQRETGLPVQSHLSENPGEIQWVKSLVPGAESYGHAYHQSGLFGGGARTVMAHCVWPSEAEMALLAEQGVYVAHCPQSNINLSSGIAPVRRLLDMGVPVGLGSDVAGGVHTSIFRAMADAVGVSKLYWRLVEGAAPPLTLEEAFYLGTLGGGSFFGRVGGFDPGCELDALVIGDRAVTGGRALTIPERLAKVVYLSDDRHILAKYVRGEKLALD